MRACLLFVLLAAVGAAGAQPGPFMVELGSPGGSFPIADGESIAVSPDGAHIYAAGPFTVVALARDAASGRMSHLQTLIDGMGGAGGVDGTRGESDLVISPDGAHVYVSGADDDAIAVLARDAGTGLLTFASMVRDGVGGAEGLGGPRALALSPDGAHLYVTALLDDSVAVYARDAGTGALTFVELEQHQVAGVPHLEFPQALVVWPDGRQVYVIATGPHVVHFERDPADGRLTWRSETKIDGPSSLISVSAIAVVPNESRLITGSTWSNGLVDLARDAKTGRLVASPLDLQPRPRPSDIVVHPTGARVFFTRAAGGYMAWRDPQSGVIDNADFTPRRTGNALAGSPDHRHLYFIGDEGLDAFSLPCVPVAGKTRVTLKRTIDDPVPNDDDLRMAGRALLLPADAARLDPPATGARIVLRAEDTVIADVMLPAGAFGGAGTAGWKTSKSGATWSFVDVTGAPSNGVRSVKLKRRDLGSAGELQVVVKGVKGTYPYDPADGRPDVSIELGPDHCLATPFGSMFGEPRCAETTTSMTCTIKR